MSVTPFGRGGFEDCLQCGGRGCGRNNGPSLGAADCCTGTIRRGGILCDESGAGPCILSADDDDDDGKSRTVGPGRFYCLCLARLSAASLSRVHTTQPIMRKTDDALYGRGRNNSRWYSYELEVTKRHSPHNSIMLHQCRRLTSELPDKKLVPVMNASVSCCL